jgi:hypothetical protein
MHHAARRPLLLAFVVVAAAACGSGTPPPTPSSSLPPVTYDEFQAAFCSSFTSLIRAVGNPDTASPSVMSRALDDAITAGDGLGGERAATAMLHELAVGRQHAGAAARWRPAAATMAQMDRLLAAFEAMTIAKRAAATQAAGAVDPQAAFERAGGIEAWTAVLQGVRSLPVPAETIPIPCRALSGQL